jgi:hypothetical protein
MILVHLRVLNHGLWHNLRNFSCRLQIPALYTQSALNSANDKELTTLDRAGRSSSTFLSSRVAALFKCFPKFSHRFPGGKAAGA